MFASPTSSSTVTGSPEKTGAVIVVLAGAVEVVGPVTPRSVAMIRAAVSPGVELAHTFVNVIVVWVRVLTKVHVTVVPAFASSGIVNEPERPG